MGTYLYAIMAGEHPLHLGELGLPDGFTRVVTLPASGLAAVVSQYLGPAFGDLPKTELLRCLAIHQRVIERAMGDHPVLPVKFGTVLDSNSEVSKVLDCWQGQLSSTLSQLGDAIEIEVAATWDLKQTFATIASQPQIASLAATIADRPANETVATRIQIGKLVKEALDYRRQECNQQVIHHLLPIVRDVQPNSLASDELALNVAFLVEHAQIDGFYARVHELDGIFENQLTFRCIGPLPPYSFATVEISRPRADEIEVARRLLGLGDYVSEREINDSYRRLAFQCHPDRNLDDPTAPERFAALATAHKRLLICVRGQPTRTDQVGNERRSEVALTTVKDTLLLTIEPSKSQLVPGMEESRERDHAVII